MGLIRLTARLARTTALATAMLPPTPVEVQTLGSFNHPSSSVATSSCQLIVSRQVAVLSSG